MFLNDKKFLSELNIDSSNTIYCDENTKIDNIKFKISGLNNNIKIHKINIEGTLYITIIGDNNKIEINEGTIIKRSLSLLIYPGGPQFKGNNCNIVIGNNNFFNGGNCLIECGEENTEIKIGNDCLFASNVRFATSDNHIIYSTKNKKRLNNPGNIMIGNHVWFCENSLILNNSTINDNSIVATRAVVTGKQFPPNSCMGGYLQKL